MDRVISVNVGAPRVVQWGDREVRTAIWKAPVADRVFARRLNLDGDGQADLVSHGGEHRAIMVYQTEAYRFWQEQFGWALLPPGSFGENLTVEGLADAEVCIGDRYRIGDALFEITQPRVTCFKVGIRLKMPELPALIVRHHRPGFYFRVIEEGEIGSGDRIEKLASGPEGMSVAEIDALLYSSHHPRDAIERALRISPLSLGWRDSMEALFKSDQAGGAGNAGLTTPIAPPAWTGFRPLQVTGSHQVCEGVRTFVLADPAGRALPTTLGGQHLVFRLPAGEGGAPVIRIYSLCGAATSGVYQIAVKDEGGPGSRYMSDKVRAGAMLDVSAPRGGFTLTADPAPVVLISAGIGVTPVLAMLRDLAAQTSDRSIWWVYGARDKAHHAFAAEARDLVAGIPHSRRLVLYSRPAGGDLLGTDFDAPGRITVDYLRQAGAPADAMFYLCGPPAFMADLQAGLGAWGVPACRIRAEAFGPAAGFAPGGLAAVNAPAPHPLEGPPGDGPRVSFARSGLSVRWASRFSSLLEFAEACAVPVRWSCRTGVCHSCESGLIDGSLRYAPEPLDPPPGGSALICCSTPVTDIELDL